MLFPQDNLDSALYINRTDPDELLGSHSNHPFDLEGKTWPTIEHYFQAMKFKDESYQEKIRLTETPEQAIKLGSRWFKRPHKEFKKQQIIYMTRAVYIQAKTYPAIAVALLDTGVQFILESSAYDYFWGCGRDRRGHNHYGQVLMNVRTKLLEEQKQEEE